MHQAYMPGRDICTRHRRSRGGSPRLDTRRGRVLKLAGHDPPPRSPPPDLRPPPLGLVRARRARPRGLRRRGIGADAPRDRRPRDGRAPEHARAGLQGQRRGPQGARLRARGREPREGPPRHQAPLASGPRRGQRRRRLRALVLPAVHHRDQGRRRRRTLRIKATPALFESATDISAKKVWDVDGPGGERELWKQLFAKIEQLL